LERLKSATYLRKRLVLGALIRIVAGLGAVVFIKGGPILVRLLSQLPGRVQTAGPPSVKEIAWDAAETAIRRVELRGLRLTGAVLAAAKLQDACFIQCRLDLCSLRFATLDRIRFEDCRLEEGDFYEATLNSVAFVDCFLSRATLGKATFERSEMRGCELSGISGADRLRGVTMPWLDVLRSAAVLADGVGFGFLTKVRCVRPPSAIG
jgi:hypothetical protein